MANVNDIHKLLEREIPRSLSCDWDNDGLMCSPDKNREVSSVLLALDLTDKVIDYAEEHGFEVILTHHPLIFKPLKSLSGADNIQRKVIRLLSSGISVMSYHTRLDALEGGVNDRLAALLGLCDTEAFGPEGECIGRVGVLPDAVDFAELCNTIKVKLGCRGLNTIPKAGNIKRIALLGGDGKDHFRSAVATGADVYLTGSLSYNIMVDAAELGIGIIEAGHYHTEAHICEYFKELIAREFPDIKTETISSDPVVVL